MVWRYSSSAGVAWSWATQPRGPPAVRRTPSYDRGVPLPLKPPVKPQLARSAADLPDGDSWRYEPKWDGFRTIVFRDGDEVHLQSRNGKPMNRYFPEIVPHILA